MHPEDLPASAVIYLPVLTRPERAPLPPQLRSEKVTVRSFEEHVEALTGPALDPLHLLLRSGLPGPGATIEDKLTLACILKAEHDLALLSGEGADMQPGWEAPLHENRTRLADCRPTNTALKRAWHGALMALEKALMPAAMAA